MRKLNSEERTNAQDRQSLYRIAARWMTIVFVLFVTNLTAQSFQWAKSILSLGFDEGYDLATDSEGNTYVCGMTEYDANFGDGMILGTAGIHDIFIAKFSPTGRIVWAKLAGGTGGDKAHSITLDGNGNLFVVGEYEDTCYWDGIMKVTNGPGINNMFVAKYDTSGTVNWVRNIGGTGALHTRGYGVACDENGDVYASGATKGDAYYNSNFLFTTAGDYDAMIVKFSSNGMFRWAKRMGGIDSDKAYGVVSDMSGSIYVTGYFAGQADFSASVDLQGSGHTDIFLAKYNYQGNLQWAKQAGDTGFDRGWDITHNINGEIVITGEFQTGHFGNNTAYSKGNEDMFLASYNSSGDNLWVVSGGGEEDDIGRGVTHDSAGSLFVVGDFASTGIFASDTLVSNGFADVFIANYSSNGSNLNWIRSFGALDNDRGRGVGADNAGYINICGEYVDSSRFDGTTLIGDTLLDIFVAKIVPGNFCATQVTVSTSNNCFGNCQAGATAAVNGNGPFSYAWSTSPVQTGITASNLCAGVYSVVTTDASGCTSSASFTLVDPPLLQVSSSSTNATCAGSCDGSALASTSGQAPFSFSWSTNPPKMDSVATGLCQGSYSVIVTDANGCTETSSVMLTDPSALQTGATVTDASCIGCSDGSIDLQVSGGTTGYQFLWSNISTDEDLANVPAGTYDVCVTDLHGCVKCDSFTVAEPTTSTNNVTDESGFSVYPNPFRASTVIHASVENGESTKYTLYSLTGQVIMGGEFSGKEFELTTPNIESGLYFLRLSEDRANRIVMIPLLIE